MRAPESQPLCRLDALIDCAPLGVDSARGELILVRTHDTVHGYENLCPHRATSLDWAKGRFLSSDGQYLQCATHAALFRMADGVCIAGPCEGDALTRVPLRFHEGAVFLEEMP